MVPAATITLASGHGRYITAAPERALVPIKGLHPNGHLTANFIGVLLPTRPCDSHFASELSPGGYRCRPTRPLGLVHLKLCFWAPAGQCKRQCQCP